MSEEREKPLTGADAEAQPTRPDVRSEPYRHPADLKGAKKLPKPQGDQDDRTDKR